MSKVSREFHFFGK